MPHEEVILKVKKTSPTKSLGSAIARELEKNPTVTCRAIGVQAVNQTVKGIAIAGGFLGQKGLSINVRIGFQTVHAPDDGSFHAEGDPVKDEITAINFLCVRTT
jgi:stage V sporulation protein SpoVS